MGLGQGTAEDREILAEHEHHAPVDGAVARDDAIARDFLSSMPKSVQRCSTNMSHSSKLPFVEQQLDALPGRELALGVLRVDALLTASEAGGFPLFFELLDDVLHCSLRSQL